VTIVDNINDKWKRFFCELSLQMIWQQPLSIPGPAPQH
jgi:hypothetical protein